MTRPGFGAIVCAAASLLAATPAFAQAKKPAAKQANVEFGMMTWPEVKQAFAEGKTTALVYTGGTEQRGPQNVNGGHTLMGQEIVKAVALRLGNGGAVSGIWMRGGQTGQNGQHGLVLDVAPAANSASVKLKDVIAVGGPPAAASAASICRRSKSRTESLSRASSAAASRRPVCLKTMASWLSTSATSTASAASFSAASRSESASR